MCIIVVVISIKMFNVEFSEREMSSSKTSRGRGTISAPQVLRRWVPCISIQLLA